MRILHVYNHFYPCVGGVEKQMEDICTNFIKRGHVSDVCCLNKCAHSDEKLKSKEKYKGITIHRISYKDLKYYKVAPKVLSIMRKYDIIHLHCMGFFLDFLTSTKKIHEKPLILSTHGGIFHTKNLGLIKKLYFNYWSKYKLKKINRIIAVSKNDKELFSKISRNVTFIPNGINTEIYSKIKRKPDKKTLLYIGRLTPNKRLDRLINTIYLMKESEPEIKLYVAGEDSGNHKKYLESIVSKSNLSKNVIFVGKISESEKIKYMKNATIFVLS
ncbi:MAG: glycosyltransferase family 4 protein, partial [Candidatus Peribacteraceae bacterium]|nr:glycosyltransferase family 4 protein [Candidatus Peribacteraceae bacterium]